MQGRGREPVPARIPLSILADEAERGVVIKEGRIAELVPAGRAATIPDAAIFEAGRHVVLPGLINTISFRHSRVPPRRRSIASCFPGCRRSIQSGQG